MIDQQNSASQGYNIHANSKHYYPKDAEFLTNDNMAKPGAKFNANRQAVMMKDEKNIGGDPLEEVYWSDLAKKEHYWQAQQPSRHHGQQHFASSLH